MPTLNEFAEASLILPTLEDASSLSLITFKNGLTEFCETSLTTKHADVFVESLLSEKGHMLLAKPNRLKHPIIKDGKLEGFAEIDDVFLYITKNIESWAINGMSNEDKTLLSYASKATLTTSNENNDITVVFWPFLASLERYEKMLSALDLDYKILESQSMTEIERIGTDIVTTSSSSGENSSSVKNYVYGYNSTDRQPTNDADTTSNRSDSSTNEKTGASASNTREYERKGTNVPNQDLLRKELSLRSRDIYSKMCDDFASLFLINVYE